MLSIAKLREAFSFRHFLIGVTVAAPAALALRALSGLPLWACFLMATAALLVNGWLATWEDNQPGGFNNLPSSDPSTPTRSETSSIAKG